MARISHTLYCQSVAVVDSVKHYLSYFSEDVGVYWYCCQNCKCQRDHNFVDNVQRYGGVSHNLAAAVVVVDYSLVHLVLVSWQMLQLLPLMKQLLRKFKIYVIIDLFAVEMKMEIYLLLIFDFDCLKSNESIDFQLSRDLMHHRHIEENSFVVSDSCRDQNQLKSVDWSLLS